MKRSPRELVINYLWIVVGSAVYALAFDWAFDPNGIAFGGVTGVAQIVNHFLPQVPVGTLVILLNVPIFLVGWRALGGHFLASSLTAMALSSLLLDLFNALIPFQPMDDPILAAIFGGAVLGLALGIIFLQGATTGGTDIIARLLKRKLAWLPTGKLLMLVDLAVVLVTAVVFRRLETALYGIVALYVSTMVMDTVLSGLDNSKVAYIISDKPEEIAQVILHELDRSVTFLDGEGGWSGAKKRVILCAFKQRQIVAVKETVRRVDPNAFMIVTSAQEIFGEGFKSYHQDAL